jgi:RNA polymerase sigma-70 factor (ECF subfamily)
MPRPTLAREESPDDPGDGSDGWIARIPRGDADAFERMVDEFAPGLRRTAFQYTRSREAAAEVVQDVFYKMWRNRATAEGFIGRKDLQAYLYRAARNQALDYAARESTRSEWRRASREEGAAVPRHAVPADALVELADLVATIDQVLAEMPERRRAVCALRWRQGLSVAEIAEQLGIAVKTAEVQIGRGLRQLRERITHQD